MIFKMSTIYHSLCLTKHLSWLVSSWSVSIDRYNFLFFIFWEPVLTDWLAKIKMLHVILKAHVNLSRFLFCFLTNKPHSRETKLEIRFTSWSILVKEISDYSKFRWLCFSTCYLCFKNLESKIMNVTCKEIRKKISNNAVSNIWFSVIIFLVQTHSAQDSR